MPSDYQLQTINNCNMIDVFQNKDNKNDTVEQLNLKVIEWKNNDNSYYIIKYNKDYLTEDNFTSIGLLRSVILQNNKIVAFSPPKSIPCSKFISDYKPDECTAQEFIEGTMINLFFDEHNDKWEIATKSSIGANMYYFINDYKHKLTFSEMFYEIIDKVNLDINSLPKNLSYSFVIQHNQNRIVSRFQSEKLYLIAAYTIDNNNFSISELSDIEVKKIFSHSKVSYPETYSISNFDDLINKWTNQNISYEHVGIILKCGNIRSKIRNPNYEYVRQLRGNQPKLQYHYLELYNSYNDELVDEYLKYYPESTSKFEQYKKEIDLFTNQLYHNYISCFIKKKQPLAAYPYQYKNHMFKLHELYITQLRSQQKYISKITVINYIKNLHPSQLMYSLNYHHRNKIQINDELSS